MEQNNFEKNVQQKLDELKIPPSDSVWTNVEKRIRKKDNGRKLVFIFLFLILVLLSGGYWLFNSTRNNTSQSHQISQLEKDSKATNNEDSSFGKSKFTSGNNYRNIDSASVSSAKTKRFKMNSPNKIAIRSKKKQRKFSHDFTSETKKNYSKPTNNKDSQFTVNNVSKLAEKKISIPEIKATTDTTTIASKIQNKVIADSFSDELKTEKTVENLTAKKDSFIKRTSKNRRWIFGITLSGGVSLIGNNILQRNYPSLDMSAGAPGNPSYYYNPSPIKNSTAFVAGIFLEKNISARDKISFGISYRYFSFTNKIGSRIDSVSSYSQYLSSNNLYSSSNSSHLYRNNFHYLEVPVSIKFQINKSKSLPLYWAAGINISELIRSNALQFQSIPGIYYDDNSMFNKTNLGFHTGFSAMFFAQEKYPLTVGPYFYYNATSVANKGLYQNKHFSFMGIQAEILFNKK